MFQFCSALLTTRNQRRFCSRACRHRSRVIPPEIRFWRFVDKVDDPISCWLWTGSAIQSYGQLKIGKKSVAAHRFAYEMTFGPLGDLLACHKCDIPLCVRNDGDQSHLFAGDSRANALDMARKQRVGGMKLTAADVLEIRRLYAAGIADQHALAQIFPVSQGNISHIIRRKTWKHVA